MAWDVLIFNLRGASPSSLDDLKESDVFPLGPAMQVRQRISTLLPDVDWSEPEWGIYGDDGVSIEFNIGNEELVENMMLHVRGDGDAISVIGRFVPSLGWKALDCSTSEFLDFQNPSEEGWKGFQAFRNKIIDKFGDKGGS